MLQHVVADGLHQMRFPQPYPTVNEKGVISIGGGFGDSQRSRVSKAIAAANDKGIKCIPAVQLGNRFFGCPVSAAAVISRLLGCENVQLHIAAHDLFDGIGDHDGITGYNKPVVKIGCGLNIITVGIQAQRLQGSRDPGGVGDITHLRLHQLACRIPYCLIIHCADLHYLHCFIQS